MPPFISRHFDEDFNEASCSPNGFFGFALLSCHASRTLSLLTFFGGDVNEGLQRLWFCFFFLNFAYFYPWTPTSIYEPLHCQHSNPFVKKISTKLGMIILLSWVQLVWFWLSDGIFFMQAVISASLLSFKLHLIQSFAFKQLWSFMFGVEQDRYVPCSKIQLMKRELWQGSTRSLYEGNHTKSTPTHSPILCHLLNKTYTSRIKHI